MNNRTQNHFFYGWFIVGVSFLCWFAADAFGWYTFGVFIGPMISDLGLTTALITGAMTIRTAIGGLSGPIIGPLVDTKHGARILMTCGAFIAGAVPFSVSRIQHLWQLYLLFGVLGAFGMIGFGGLVTNALICKWFIRKRGRAIGISTMGVSIAGMVFVPLAHYFISTFGWRQTLVIFAFIIWGTTFLPVAFLVRRRPEDIGLWPDGIRPERLNSLTSIPTETSHYTGNEETWTLKEALQTRTLWVLLFGFNMAGLALGGAFIHFFPFVETKGFTSDTAAGALTTLAFFAALVKIPWGLIAERIHIRYCITTCYFGCTLCFIILLYSQNISLVFASAAAYGITLGGDMVLKELVWANYYGRTFLGTIRGVMMPINLLSMAGGPLFAAYLRDITGSYQLPFTLFFIASAIGTFFVFIVKPPLKNPERLTV